MIIIPFPGQGVGAAGYPAPRSYQESSCQRFGKDKASVDLVSWEGGREPLWQLPLLFWLQLLPDLSLLGLLLPQERKRFSSHVPMNPGLC